MLGILQEFSCFRSECSESFAGGRRDPLGKRLDGLQRGGVHDGLIGHLGGFCGLLGIEPAFAGHGIRPREVAVYAARFMEVLVVGHLHEQPFHVGALVEPVELGGHHDGVDRRRGVGAPGRVAEEEVLAADHEGLDGPLCDVVVDESESDSHG